MKKVVIGLLCTAIVGLFVSASPDEASARPKYFMRFQARYGERIEAIETQRCAICHGGENGANKKIISEYAQALLAALDDMKNCMDDAKIDAAIEKLEAMPSAENGPTYGELLNEGKLPAPAPVEEE